ncbi:uncharacterized protein LACBIDRAFT_313701 [Laccaria bicolor S238N-H82]|uniref:Predicted protein n=1 Tax=Laccaria bicolor (strain S238N-H82 / ATCC MYA-4686) TaxID=486041 RepID=B0D0L7_LACBS|nr:uncharacterized protein LACBIDRAFT_313701 [Laccaria bicolor S238N-H82]EDR11482.1 predicted protein [Laccaria bicolor S238N-H82]|eukprot:XP_001877379.1 predicted protein [Laccaria bicolor S238N-H82]
MNGPRRKVPPPPPRYSLPKLPETLETPALPPRRPKQPPLPSVNSDLARLLARRPPPPPRRSTRSVPLDHSREEFQHQHKPPIKPNYTPPPIPNFATKPVLVAQVITQSDPSCLECRDFSSVDAHAACYPRHSVVSLESLSQELTEPFGSEVDKARAIFTWLHHNIAYDAESFFSGNIRPATPESTLSSGVAVCDGYAGLFKYLAECIGLQVHKVTGHGKGVGYAALEPNDPIPPKQMNHAWNCILMDGEWHLIDSCWGAGYLDGATYTPRFTPTWFTSPPLEFGRRHFPDDPTYQLLSEDEGGPITWEEYICEPEGPQLFRNFYDLDLHPYSLQPSTKMIEGGRFTTFIVNKRCEHMSTAEADNYVFLLNTGSGASVPLTNTQGGWSVTLNIPPSTEVTLLSVTVISDQDAKGLGVFGYQNSVGRKGMSFGVLARWTSE